MPAKNTEQPAVQDRSVFTWETPAYLQYPKTKLWLTVAGVILASLILYGFIWGSALFSLAIIAWGLAYYLQNQNPPPILKIELTEMGVRVNENFYQYSEFKSFWIVFHPPEISVLCFKTTRAFNANLTLQLGEMEPAPLREFLKTQLPEAQHKKEGLLNLLVRILRL